MESRSLDLADLASVRSFAAGLADLDRIDVLVNNAGLILDHRTETAQGFEGTFGTNHLGHHLLTRLVLDQVRAAPAGRVVCVASVAHAAAVGGMTWGDLGRPPVVQHVARLRRVQAGQHPPRPGPGPAAGGQSAWSRTRCTRATSAPTSGPRATPGGGTSRLIRLGDHVLIPPAEGARTSIHVASSPEAGACTGRYWSSCRPARPAPWAMRAGAADRLWTTSERMLAAVT